MVNAFNELNRIVFKNWCVITETSCNEGESDAARRFVKLTRKYLP